MLFISIFHSYKKCLKKGFFNLITLTSCHYIKHIKSHKNFVFLAVTNLRCKNHPNFYKLLRLLSGDVSLNPEPIQIETLFRYKPYHMGTTQ